MKRNFTLLSFIFVLCSSKFIAQTYNAVNLTGFNYDVIAESKPASAVTGIAIEGNYVLYSTAYTGSVVASGLSAAGVYSTSTRTYSLAAYTQKNTLRVGFNTTDSVTLVTPAKYSVVSLLGFSAVADAMADITLKFTDGSSVTYTSKTFYNWTSPQTAFISGFGKTNRTTDLTYYTATDPKMYTIDLPVACANQSKLLSKILVKNNTNASFVHVFAAAGVSLSSFLTSSVPATCKGSNTGSAKVFGFDTYAPLTYTWSSLPVQNTASATNLPAGNYTVTVGDGNGCVYTNTVSIGEPAVSFSVTAISGSSVACITSTAGVAQVTVTGGNTPYTYTWTNSSATTNSVSGLVPNTYTVYAQDANNCVISATTNVTSPAVSISVNTSSLLCGATPNATATVGSITGATAPYTYTWTSNPVQTTTVATALAAGSYSVLVKDVSGCVNTQTFSIIAPDFSLATANATCTSATGSATVSAITGGSGGPYTYTWTPSAQTTSIATAMAPGNYTVIVKDAAACATTKTLSIAGTFATLSVNTTSLLCSNLTNGTASVSITGGAGGPYTYTWSSLPTQTTATASNLAAGNYSVTVSGISGCVSTQTFVITKPSLTIATTSLACQGLANGSAIVTSVNGGVGPYLYYWNGSVAATGSSMAGLDAGTYSVSVIDANNCSINAPYIIAGPAAIFAAVVSTSATTCSGINDGKASVAPSGAVAPYTYFWSSNPPQYTPLATGLASPTVYTCTIIDYNNCILKKTANILPVPLSINVYVSPSNTICPGKPVTLSVSGAVSYTWSTGANTQSITVTPPLTSTLTAYSFTGTASTGCFVSGTTSINTSSVATGFCPPTGIQEYANASYNIYPNPNTGKFVLKLDVMQDNSVIELIDALGKVVVSQAVVNEETTVNTSGLQDGIYFVIVKNNDRVIVRTKIIKQ